MFGWLFGKKSDKSKGAPTKQPAKAPPSAVVATKKEMGTVVSFGLKYGFVTTDSGQKVFVHNTIYPKGAQLKKGDKVQVSYGKAPQGLQATEIRKID